MAWPLDELLHVKVAVAECPRGLAGSLLEKPRQLVGIAADPHAAPAASGHRLQNYRIAHALRPLQRIAFALDHSVRPRQNRHPRLLHGLPRGGLLAHQPHHLGWRPDELYIRRAAHFGEVRVLAQQPIARMDRVHIRDLRRRDHRWHVQVALRRARRPDADRLVGKAHVQAVAVRLAVYRDGADAHLPARRDYPQRNLTTICNQYLTKHIHQDFPSLNVVWLVGTPAGNRSWRRTKSRYLEGIGSTWTCRRVQDLEPL